jgi:glycosyltransferase involved in cell wall biosynthesis
MAEPMGHLKPVAACLVLVRNGVAVGLEKCLESACAAGFEPWVLDDESTDDTFLVCKKYRAKYKHHSAKGERKNEIWQTHEDVLRGILTDWALESDYPLFATLDADEWFMSPLTTGQLAREMVAFNLADSIFMRTVNFWNDRKHFKVFPNDPNYARPRLWRVDRDADNRPHAQTMGVQAPLYAHKGCRVVANWTLCVGHTGYLDKAARLAKAKRYRELGAGSWAAAIASESRVCVWDPETLRGLP